METCVSGAWKIGACVYVEEDDSSNFNLKLQCWNWLISVLRESESKTILLICHQCPFSIFHSTWLGREMGSLFEWLIQTCELHKSRKQFNVVKPTTFFYCVSTHRIKTQLIQKHEEKNKLTVEQSSTSTRSEHRGGGIMWWLMGLFDLSSDAAGTFSEQWSPEVPASPVPHKNEAVRFSTCMIYVLKHFSVDADVLFLVL